MRRISAVLGALALLVVSCSRDGAHSRPAPATQASAPAASESAPAGTLGLRDRGDLTLPSPSTRASRADQARRVKYRSSSRAPH